MSLIAENENRDEYTKRPSSLTAHGLFSPLKGCFTPLSEVAMQQ